MNHVLNLKRRDGQMSWTFERYGQSLDDAFADIHRGHPFHDAPDFILSLRKLLDRPEFKKLLEFH